MAHFQEYWGDSVDLLMSLHVLPLLPDKKRKKKKSLFVSPGTFCPIPRDMQSVAEIYLIQLPEVEGAHRESIRRGLAGILSPGNRVMSIFFLIKIRKESVWVKY